MPAASGRQISPANHLTVPQRLGPYRICGRLGEGGMNVVLRARHGLLQREVALKVLPPEKGDGVASTQRGARFTAEARAGAAVSHPHVNTCFDAGKDQGWGYLALELMPGGDLRGLCRQRGGRLPERFAVATIRAVAHGLAALHRAGFVHRDVKPNNILLGRDLAPQLADFGVAARVDRQRVGTLVGSLGYMSPEALDGMPCDVRSDVYSLAVTCFEMVTGQLPFLRKESAIGNGRRSAAPVPSCRDRRGSLSIALQGVLLRAMSPDPDERHGSAQAFADALGDCLDVALPSRPAPVARPLRAAAPSCELVLGSF